MQPGRTIFRCTAFGVALLAAGCLTPKKSADYKAANRSNSDVKQAAHTEALGTPIQHEGLNQAEQVYKNGDFDKAGDMFGAIADDTKNRPEVAERARFYQAECLRRQGYYPKAVDTYHKLLQDFPAGLYREQAVGQMFMIASEWLQPVRDEIADKNKPEKERKSKSWTGQHHPRQLRSQAADGRRPRIGPCKRWNASTSTIRPARMPTRRCSCSAASTSSGRTSKTQPAISNS